MIEFTNRQRNIIEIVKKKEPITAEHIADLVGVSKAALRSDLAVLVMTNALESKPKVGYFVGKTLYNGQANVGYLQQLKVKDIQSVPIIVDGKSTVQEVVIKLFLENVGSIMVVDEKGYLEGIVSRKDLLKVTLGNANATTMPVNLVMTRHPNIVTILPDESVLEAARKMIHFQVDSLPVVERSVGGNDDKKMVIGRITKTNMTRMLLDLENGE
ncbi:histidine kinase [Alkalihalobacillus alcalophilus ATCC 27647 = CGMCC 1.3604]|uniref:Histidine kinase n=1 Tax=Alkalihalobacillus alcalophilus ATCC 27647 = CGMCC 1.3604 TaxID=1218173 RepID=A0A094XJG0_ALKAL|nr:helix-turn-helix transcriptional regulator [Alkalihalobacillus alcalophilus]KGA98895.1 histidine kinase [Alkalihalobacillus alcalophilus ATCC 27647 = CGMCC 1.3604]MED1560533.1 helix-turn-helix transcriptional regulator [Alkalihalobacillus alcalophilus]THG88881.1 histidine kinase [Alkalihalobacillus alcalophilus ATCC 27647 = CGMCC 1.3604]